MSLHSVPLGGSSGNERVIPIFIKVAFAQAEFANHPKEINANSTAKNVRAKITYLKPDKSVIGFVMGRWAGEDNSQDLEIVDLLSNGKPRVLYLAMKYADDDRDGLYMYGMETSTNYFWHR